MANNKHLTLDERYFIFHALDQNKNFSQIGKELDKDPSTISKEIRSHFIYKKSCNIGRSYNSCIHRSTCRISGVCFPCNAARNYRYCFSCALCNSSCSDFVQEFCPRHSVPPYVCNGCKKLRSCTLEKHFYKPSLADSEYRKVLSESRTGMNLSEAEIAHLDSVISPLILKGQSLNHIFANNQDSIMYSRKTIYRMINYNLFSARNIDLRRKMTLRVRKVKVHYKVDKSCRCKRTYKDYLIYMDLHPFLPVTQIDSVEGKKGGKVLLTIHFVKPEFMLAFIRDANDSQSVIDIFNRLYLEIRPDIFITIMPVLLGDNGSEFSNPAALEFDLQDNRRTHVFYCDPASPGQKGSAERNHEFIRYFVPQGQSWDSYTQEDISLMMDHINSYCRESLGNKCPYDMFSFLYGEEVLTNLGCHKINANDVTLNNSIWKKGDK